MRYISQLFQPVLTVPKNAKIKNTEITCKSQKLLLECGLIRPTSTGLFALLPLAQRALDKLEALITKHIESAGAQRISLPSLAADSLWERTGRIALGPELMTVEDRHQKRYLLAPTHEEGIADLLASAGPLSYKQLPLLLYQVGGKYRDERRPKHGLLRARQFRMLDAYGAHAQMSCARHSYQRLTESYTTIFKELALPTHAVEAPTGDMGGSLSHEWQLLAPAGEDAVDICPSCAHTLLAVDERTRQCDQCGKEMDRKNSIEVGHTFILGTKYSEALGALFTPAQGPAQPLIMSCYGIGTTRLLAASLEALSSETALRWPLRLAPYSTLLIGPKEGSKEWSAHGWDAVRGLARRLERATGDQVLVDDRHHLTIGKRVVMADKMGYPNIIVCGRGALEHPPRYELAGAGAAAAAAGAHRPPLLTESELLAALRPAEEDDDVQIKTENYTIV